MLHTRKKRKEKVRIESPKKLNNLMNPSFLPSPGGISKSLILPPPEKAKIWHALCCLDAGGDAVGESV